MASNTGKLFLSVTLILLIALSIVIVALESTSKDFVDKNKNAGFSIYPDRSRNEARTILALPMQLDMERSDFTLGVSVISLVAGLAGLPFSIWLFRNEKKVRTLRGDKLSASNILVAHVQQMNWMTPVYAFLATLTSTALLSLASLLTMFITHARSAHFDPNYKTHWGWYGPAGAYTKGVFDLETWVCELAYYRGSDGTRNFSKQCSIEQAARWLLLPFCIVSIVAAGLGWWVMVREKAIVDAANAAAIKNRDADDMAALHKRRD
ncbi:hypothetical protein H2201_003116 [Coniosporium apollinis]|uniref:Uncharacterized protein n=2 Tax=Coniosporium TaxID=2810619 RepID=A0ABQ9P2W9_9PEZI|nr:hypothetical protein H2199_008457 [Cladosporium sp. JES 115]KAJ9666712.1 hypothetical protein H2201_003116 [Coniosporium apollinis]